MLPSMAAVLERATRSPAPARPVLGRVRREAGLYGRAAAEAVAETLWPTRCAVCDEPGEVLCARCRMMLPHLDWWRACPRCGAPFGRVQCSECNPVVLGASGLDEPPFDGCASAVVYGDDAARVVRTWKDSSERRLVEEMAGLMALVAVPAWLEGRPAVVPVPATSAALRRRGFDHGADLARATAERLGLDVAPLLARPRSRDQRALARRGRIANMEGRFLALPGADAPEAAIIVDDVYTTGSTLFAATQAVRAAGARRVYGLTFARVW
ncbi:ComF family protein [Arabiibacter massiliensis]|uniref:ComF family protein n=1 Tax=Arabiibacter massiliensis TaxID=1870985 RepID=UPI001E5F4BC5|nr:ComF family protein [Arabiibacter massiliensis]